MTGLFQNNTEEFTTVSRRDPKDLLGTFSAHAIFLDDATWPTVEHYFQAMQFEDPSKQAVIRAAPNPDEALRLGEPGFLKALLRKRRPDWNNLRSIYMTRAVYTKCRSYPVVAERLLGTGDQKLVENSQYDYYWGCGRDFRGVNMYGQILMNVRQKLRDEATSSS